MKNSYFWLLHDIEEKQRVLDLFADWERENAYSYEFEVSKCMKSKASKRYLSENKDQSLKSVNCVINMIEVDQRSDMRDENVHSKNSEYMISSNSESTRSLTMDLKQLERKYAMNQKRFNELDMNSDAFSRTNVERHECIDFGTNGQATVNMDELKSQDYDNDILCIEKEKNDKFNILNPMKNRTLSRFDFHDPIRTETRNTINDADDDENSFDLSNRMSTNFSAFDESTIIGTAFDKDYQLMDGKKTRRIFSKFQIFDRIEKSLIYDSFIKKLKNVKMHLLAADCFRALTSKPPSLIHKFSDNSDSLNQYYRMEEIDHKTVVTIFQLKNHKMSRIDELHCKMNISSDKGFICVEDIDLLGIFSDNWNIIVKSLKLLVADEKSKLVYSEFLRNYFAIINYRKANKKVNIKDVDDACSISQTVILDFNKNLFYHCFELFDSIYDYLCGLRINDYSLNQFHNDQIKGKFCSSRNNMNHSESMKTNEYQGKNNIPSHISKTSTNVFGDQIRNAGSCKILGARDGIKRGSKNSIKSHRSDKSFRTYNGEKDCSRTLNSKFSSILRLLDRILSRKEKSTVISKIDCSNSEKIHEEETRNLYPTSRGILDCQQKEYVSKGLTNISSTNTSKKLRTMDARDDFSEIQQVGMSDPNTCKKLKSVDNKNSERDYINTSNSNRNENKFGSIFRYRRKNPPMQEYIDKCASTFPIKKATKSWNGNKQKNILKDLFTSPLKNNVKTWNGNKQKNILKDLFTSPLKDKIKSPDRNQRENKSKTLTISPLKTRVKTSTINRIKNQLKTSLTDQPRSFIRNRKFKSKTTIKFKKNKPKSHILGRKNQKNDLFKKQNKFKLAQYDIAAELMNRLYHKPTNSSEKEGTLESGLKKDDDKSFVNDSNCRVNRNKPNLTIPTNQKTLSYFFDQISPIDHISPESKRTLVTRLYNSNLKLRPSLNSRIFFGSKQNKKYSTCNTPSRNRKRFNMFKRLNTIFSPKNKNNYLDMGRISFDTQTTRINRKFNQEEIDLINSFNQGNEKINIKMISKNLPKLKINKKSITFSNYSPLRKPVYLNSTMMYT